MKKQFTASVITQDLGSWTCTIYDNGKPCIQLLFPTEEKTAQRRDEILNTLNK